MVKNKPAFRIYFDTSFVWLYPINQFARDVCTIGHADIPCDCGYKLKFCDCVKKPFYAPTLEA